MKEFEINFAKFTPCPYGLQTADGYKICISMKECEMCRYYRGGNIITVRCSYDEAGGAR